MEFLDLPIYDNILDEFLDRKSFLESCYELRALEELCNPVDELQRYFDETYMSEALNDINQSAAKTVGNALKATRDTTTGMVKAHSALTTSLGNAMGTTYNLLYNLAMGIIKIITFIFNSFTILPRMLLKVTNAVGNIPGDVRSKVNGDIQLFITAEDISVMYEHSIIKKLKLFIANAAAMSKGDMWGSKHHMTSKDNDGEKIKATNNDIGLAKQLHKSYLDLSQISFSKTLIKINDDSVRKLYFSKDDSGSGSYFKRMDQLLKDVRGMESDLRDIKKSLEEKYNKTVDNGTFIKMGNSIEGSMNQSWITNSISDVSKTMTIIGNLLKNIHEDINTINSAVNKILKADKK